MSGFPMLADLGPRRAAEVVNRQVSTQTGTRGGRPERCRCERRLAEQRAQPGRIGGDRSRWHGNDLAAAHDRRTDLGLYLPAGLTGRSAQIFFREVRLCSTDLSRVNGSFVPCIA
jgi:hypothetical protein